MALEWFKDGKGDVINAGIETTLQELSVKEREQCLFSLFDNINKIPEKPYLQGKEGEVTTIQKTAMKQNIMYRGFLRKFAKDKTVDLKKWAQDGDLIKESFNLLKKTADFADLEVKLVHYKGHPLKDAFRKGFVKYYLHTVLGPKSYQKLLQEYDSNKKDKKIILLDFAQQKYPDIVKLNQSDLDAKSEIIFSSISSLSNEMTCNSSDGYTSQESTGSINSESQSTTGVSSQYGGSSTHDGSVISHDSNVSNWSNLTESNLKLHNTKSFTDSKKYNLKNKVLKFCSKAKRLFFSSRLVNNRNDSSQKTNEGQVVRPKVIKQMPIQEQLSNKFMGNENKTGSQK